MILLHGFLSTFFLYGQADFIYHIDHLSGGNGLPHIDVSDIIEDEKGFIWIATLSGLSKFDGYQVQSFHMGTHGGQDKNRCNSLVQGQDQMLWVGTEGGLCNFNLETEQELPLLIRDPNWQFISEESVDLHLCDKEGNLWISVKQLLLRLEISSGEVVGVQNLTSIFSGANPLYINDVAEDENHNFWVGTNFGLYQIVKNQGGFRLHHHLSSTSGPARLDEEYISSLDFDRHGNLVAGSIRQLAIIFLSDSEQGLSYPDSARILDIPGWMENHGKNLGHLQKLEHIKSSARDSKNNWWFSTDIGILKFNSDSTYSEYEFSLLSKSESRANSLNSEVISMLFINREDCLFAGTYGGGVNYFDTRQKEIYWLGKDIEHPDGSLSENIVRSIAEDSKQNLWIGTQNGGLNFYESRTGRITSYDLGISSMGKKRNNIRALKLELDRYLWVGTINEVYCFDTHRELVMDLAREVSRELMVNHGYVSDIEIDSFNNLWISTWGEGLFYCNREATDPFGFRGILHMSSKGKGITFFANDFTNSVCITPENSSVMIGSRKGLVHFSLDEEGHISSYRHYSTRRDSGSKNKYDFIWDIVPAGDGLYYIGSIGQGLLKLDMNKFNQSEGGIPYLETVHLPEAYQLTDIEAILKDGEGNLWLAGKSLYFFDTKREAMLAYDFDKAIFGNNFKVGASCRGASGMLYFGGIKGVSMLHPEQVVPNTYIPRVQLTGIKVHNNPVIPGLAISGKVIIDRSMAYIDKLTLNHQHNDFSISFSSLQFQNPEKIWYKYKLEGYDREWKSTLGSMPEANYSNLKFGRYKFIVHASNNDGEWSYEPRILNVYVKPPWWKSKVALISYIWIIIMLIVGIYYNQSRFYRMKHDLAISNIEKEKSEELHQLKLRFFTDISHEFRTPISLILAYRYRKECPETPQADQ